MDPRRAPVGPITHVCHQNTATTLAGLIRGEFDSVCGFTLRRLLDRGGELPAWLDRRSDAATVRALAAALPELFWTRRVYSMLRSDLDMFGLVPWLELDDARAMADLARRHCASDVALDARLASRVRFYELHLRRRRDERAWWAHVVLRQSTHGDALSPKLNEVCPFSGVASTRGLDVWTSSAARTEASLRL